MEKKAPFMITQARPEDAAALLDYLKCVGGETDNLSFGPKGVPLDVEAETQYLAAQVASKDNVQYLAWADGQIIGDASLNRKPRRMSHRGRVRDQRVKSLLGLRGHLRAHGSRSCVCCGKRL